MSAAGDVLEQEARKRREAIGEKYRNTCVRCGYPRSDLGILYGMRDICPTSIFQGPFDVPHVPDKE